MERLDKAYWEGKAAMLAALDTATGYVYSEGFSRAIRAMEPVRVNGRECHMSVSGDSMFLTATAMRGDDILDFFHATLKDAHNPAKARWACEVCMVSTTRTRAVSIPYCDPEALFRHIDRVTAEVQAVQDDPEATQDQKGWINIKTWRRIKGYPV